MPQKSGILKHPIIKDVDYIDVKRGGVLLKTYGKELNNKTWRQFQLLIGSEFGSGKYHYQYKMKNDDKISKGQINGVNTKHKESMDIVKRDIDLVPLTKAIEDINKRIDESKSGMGFELVISSMKSMHETHTVFLNNEITRRDNIIIRCENKIDDLESELAEVEGSGSSGTLETFKMIYELVSTKLTGVNPVTNLQDSDQSDIPPEILKLLGMVDWSSVQPEIKTMIIDTLGKYIQKLPMKGK